MNDNIEEIPINMEVFRVYIERTIEELSLKEINKSNLDLIIVDSDKRLGELMIFQLSQRIAALPEEEIRIFRRWPKTWWDAFKDHWFPLWAKTRWPIQWDEVNVREKRYGPVCTHLGTDPTEEHLRFILRNRKGQ
jgi:hypothetical protein